ncbi:putative disease resistance protein RGA3 [Quercus suber]|uniref:putative disease resistance protein RGA3 n=1 Tax=Quercus suber TaxID=58331 RepID=UPI0032E01950
MADALLTDVLKQLGSIAAQQAQHEIKLIVGVDEEVQNLQHSFTMVQAMLNNAEERQFMDSAVKLWFEEAAADSNTLALKKKVCPFYPSLSCCFRQADNLSLRHEIGHKIEKLNETLDKILNDKGKYGFDLSRQIPVQVQRPKTTSDDVDESDITGRNKDIDELLHNPLEKGSQEDRKPFVISCPTSL